MPVEITGLSDNPSAGDKFMAFETEKKARSVSEKGQPYFHQLTVIKKQ